MIFKRRRARSALRKEVLRLWPEGGPFTSFKMLRNRDDRRMFAAEGPHGQVLGNLFHTDDIHTSVTNHATGYTYILDLLGPENVPRIVHADPATGLLVLARPDGTDLGTILAKQPKDATEALEAVRLAAAWLRKLHDSVYKTPSRIGMDNLLHRQAAWINEGPLKAEVFLRGAELAPLFFQQTKFHKDYAARNVFVDGDRAMAIDMRPTSLRPPQFDIARFLRTASGNRLSRPFDGPVSRIGVPLELCDAFDAGYRRVIAQDPLTELQLLIEMAQFQHEITPMSRFEIAARARRNPMFKGQLVLLDQISAALTA